MSVKTLVVYSDFQLLPSFYVVDGDKRNWHNVIVTAGYTEDYDGSEEAYKQAEKEIIATIFPADLNGYQLEPTATTLSDALAAIYNGELKDFYTAVCGFAP